MSRPAPTAAGVSRPQPALAEPGSGRGPGAGTGEATGTTVGAWLRAATLTLRTAGSATARQDAECLLARALHATRLALLVQAGRLLSPGERLAGEALLVRRVRQEPIQYLLGEAPFRDLVLAVGPGVFIPRPETELLVDRALARCPTEPAVVVELCAGSGAVACALAHARPLARIWAIERSPAALAWARQNVERLGFSERITLLEGDLFDPLVAGSGPAAPADLVVANPPYIPRPVLAMLPAEVRDWEPPEALDGGGDGTEVARAIVDGAPAVLRPGGSLVLELGDGQVAAMRAHLAADDHYGVASVHRDVSGRERVLEVWRR